MPPVLRTERLVLRHLSPADAAFLVELLNDPSFLRHVGDRKVRSVEDAVRYVETGPLAREGTGGFGLCGVALAESGTLLGICGLLQREALEQPDIGFALLPRFRGLGYAAEAAAAVLAHAQGTLLLSRVLAITSLDNEASIRVLERLRFRFERLARLSPEGQELRVYAHTREAR